LTAYADLHLHTTKSDGNLSPSELIQLIKKTSLQVVSITDHDSTDGIDEAVQAGLDAPNLQIIPGIELGTDIPGTDIHILGHWIDPKDVTLQNHLKDFRTGRETRARRTVEKLATLGIDIDIDRVFEIAQGAVGRPHIAQVMVEKGYITYPQQAFEKYLGKNGLAYISRNVLSPVEAITLITNAKGIATLAHPREAENVESLLPNMVNAGLAGIEIHYKGYSQSDKSRFRALADQYNLIALGGTDYHAFGTPGEIIPGTVGPPKNEVEKLKQLSLLTRK
jgi:predicted metal-dependent phosphoesterase TrpH